MEQIITPVAGASMVGAVPGSGPIPFAGKSAASWPSIIAGAFVAAAATLILFALGSGIGLALISPWTHHGALVTSFAMSGAIWIILTQWIAAALGGYIAGRLRTRWVGTHTHEVFFRDTAHGLITWAVATVLVALLFTGSLMSGAGAAGHVAVATATATASSATPNPAVSAYSLDKLFRSTSPNSGTPGSASTDPRIETVHIAANALTSGNIPDADRAYLVDQVSARAGISAADAQTRVDAFIASVMQAGATLKADAETARKAAAQASIYLALSMLIGAFIASVAAVLGGRLRDEHL